MRATGQRLPEGGRRPIASFFTAGHGIPAPI